MFNEEEKFALSLLRLKMSGTSRWWWWVGFVGEDDDDDEYMWLESSVEL